MYLLGHNAHLTLIQAPGVAADPSQNITGSGPTTRWQGTAEAYVDEDIVDVVKGSTSTGAYRVQVSQTMVDLPANLPVWPNEEDLITIVRVGVVANYAPAGPHTEVLVVRKTDGGLLMLGKLRLYVVRS
jgi:hypothetical protein